MSPAALKRAAMALVVLVVLWAAFGVFRGSLSDDPQTLRIRTLATGEVDRFRIAGSDDTLEFTVTPSGGWQVNGHPAAQDQVEDLMAATADTAYQAELIARSAGSHARLGVDSAGARHVTFRAGDETLIDLYLGEPGRDFRSTYVRPAGEEPVYLFRGTFTTLLSRGLDAWRDRHIAGVEAPDIAEMDVVTPESRYTLRRSSDGGWIAGDRTADSGTVGQMLRELRSLRAAGFPADSQLGAIAFDPPHRRLTVRGPGGDTLLALVFDSTAGGVWVRHDSGGVVWRIDTWRAEDVTPPESLLVGRR